ncbi:hypothetical protein P167DRAFT_539998 [Morchella conica CCBAS932]|uniref:Uncharacterized protein n=1 Tax=Morchella conica CCBAS932 TaxID=1392247 RepID=A0A3N4KAP5_9PEZI|nr:hypothetical protein P167DRAFT_539998 [Morchella conica CCBAS932]
MEWMKRDEQSTDYLTGPSEAVCIGAVGLSVFLMLYMELESSQIPTRFFSVLPSTRTTRTTNR